jgi:hypothetical protein
MPDEALLESLRRRLPDDFSRKMLDGALKALGKADDPVGAHQFAATMRELMDHVLEVMAPTADVMRCPWFKQDKEREGPTRRQRALYTCRGGLTDDFLKNRLKLKPEDLHRGFSEAFQELNKQTHIRPDTVLNDADEIEEFANNVIAALDGVFDAIDEVKETITNAINKELHGEAMSAFVRETIAELDEIAGHYNTGAVWIEETKVVSLDADSIQYHIEGSVDVTLMHGPKADGVEFEENFPYQCTTTAPASDPTNFDTSKTEMKVDTSSWHGDGDDDDGEEDKQEK